VLTEEFREAFKWQRAAIGLDAASVYVPHPMQNRTTAELHAFADKAADTILATICSPASEQLEAPSLSLRALPAHVDT
jgi:hypothetical protein